MSFGYSSARGYPSEIKAKEKDLPLDTVSSIVWDVYNQDPVFAATSWDGFVRLYMISNNVSFELNKIFEVFLHHPVLCADFNDSGLLFTGLASGDVLVIEIKSGSYMSLGNHDAPICGIYWINQFGLLMTLGYDNLIKFWRVQPENALQTQLELPLKTVTCSFDFPYLLIGSAQTTIAIISLKNLPNINLPKTDDYFKSSIERFSKFCSSRIICSNCSCVMGTIDGRSLCFTFKDGYGKMEIVAPFVARVQKTIIRNTTYYGQVNCVDIGFHNYDVFSIIGGSEDLGIFNTIKKSKVKTLATAGSATGAGTAVRISPKNEYVAYATGSDWLRGLYELESIKKPRIAVVKLSNSDLNDFIAK